MNSPPSTLEAHLGYWLRCLSNAVHHGFAEKLETHGVSVAQWVVLRVLYDEANITLNEAAVKVGVDKSSLSRMVERLVQKGLVSRVAGREDRRSIRMALTTAGRKLVPVLARLADENDRQFFKVLDGVQRREMLERVKQLLDANGWDPSTHGKDRME